MCFFPAPVVSCKPGSASQSDGILPKMETIPSDLKLTKFHELLSYFVIFIRTIFFKHICDPLKYIASDANIRKKV